MSEGIQVYKSFSVGGETGYVMVHQWVNYIAKDANGPVWGYRLRPFIDLDEDDTLWFIRDVDNSDVQALTVPMLDDVPWMKSMRRLY